MKSFLEGQGRVSRSDLVLIGQAVRKRWLTDNLKDQAVDVLADALQSTDERIRVKAVSILKDLEAQNQKDEHSELAQVREQIIAIASQFGIDLSDAGIGKPTKRIEADSD